MTEDKPVLRRVFAGTFLSAADQERLSALGTRYKADLSHLWHRKVRGVKSVKLHLTWLFLGEIDDTIIPRVAERLAAVAEQHESMQIDYDRLELWPSPRKARMLVLTPAAVPDAVLALSSDIKRELLQFAVKKEDRAFRPHITVMRIDQDRRGEGAHQASTKLTLPDWLDTGDTLPLAQNVRSISLIESELGAGRDEYVTLQSFPLRTPRS